MRTYTKTDIDKLKKKADMFKAYATYSDLIDALDFIEESGLLIKDEPLAKTPKEPFRNESIHRCPWCHQAYDYDKGHDCSYWNKHMQDSCM